MKNPGFPRGNLRHCLSNSTSNNMCAMFSVYILYMYTVSMNDELSQHKIELLDGQEPFRGLGIRHPLRLIDYWRWSGSELMNNTTRGILAEFLVAAALGLHKEPREEWKEYDLCTKSGTTIEVKSSAYVQSWKQLKPSVIQFGIAPHRKWNPETEQYSYSRTAGRWADLYIFCVFTSKEPPFDPLNTNSWEFYVLPTEMLNLEAPEQKTIRLSSLKKLSPHKCSYADLKKTILDVEREIKL